MWVLDARFKAEKVWYPVVWEKAKDAENVIDYNIHEEITIDNSSVFNANNDTTTGMANVIPWVNAPKLIASTSIYWADAGSYSWWIWAEFEPESAMAIAAWWYEELEVTRITSTRNERWNFKFKYVEWRWLIIPINWAYTLECTYARSGGGSGLEAVYDTMLWNDVVHSSATITTWGWTVETFKINATKWKPLYFNIKVDNTSSSTRNIVPFIWLTITKWA